ncbi:DNA glycosylase AlkZ-like family protein [Friedmanniella luteola]|uniref:DNA glycosylase AlkZ-like family protein n=1 Tax=Friedmanniella luteola TaxID=546871 RepID=UPI000B8215B2|nr:crosslink repair DNA glycosylase YcaQ family protein [Friedmanniella luteola]
MLGPQRDGQSTFRLLRDDPAWPGLLDVEDAGRELVTRYLGSYGPATSANLHYWFTDGLGAPRRRLDSWLSDVADHVTVDGDGGGGGEEWYVLNADLEALHAAELSVTVRLLPPFDPWILGPGTADPRLIAPARRALFSQGANPVIVGGAVAGTWRLRARMVEVSCFHEAGALPEGSFDAELQRLAAISANGLSITSSTA